MMQVHIDKSEYVIALIKSGSLAKSASREEGVQIGLAFLAIWDEQHSEETRKQLDNLVNPRPCTPIFITRTCREGGGRCDPPRVSKLTVVGLSRKDRRIALDEYSRFVVRFLVLDQYLTQL